MQKAMKVIDLYLRLFNKLNSITQQDYINMILFFIGYIKINCPYTLGKDNCTAQK